MPEPWHELPLRLVTPAFLGHFDATDQNQAVVPFPVPSLRGVLAYWLRALAGAHVGNDTERLHDVEAAVFGAARTDTSGGQSPIQLRACRVRLTVFDFRDESDGVRYLMGPGLTASTDQPPRFLPPGSVSVRVRNLGSPPAADLFLSALWALRTFGGIGARTRRGFGTLALPGVPEITTGSFDLAWLRRDQAGDLGAVIGCVGAAIGELRLAISLRPDKTAEDAPLYPCFAANGYRCGSDDEDQLRGTATDWRSALDNTGTWLWGFRHGASRRIPQSQPARGAHSQSYDDVIKPYLDHPTGQRTQKGPFTAAALGLPIPYSDHQGPRDSKNKAGQRTAVVDVQINGQPARRASPLWLRVRRDQATWRLRSLAFYNEWLPPSATTRLQVKQKSSPPGPIELLTAQQVRNELDRWFDG